MSGGGVARDPVILDLAHGVAAAVAVADDPADARTPLPPGAAPWPLVAALAALHPAERAHAAALAPARRRDWVAGRLALRAALARAGAAAAGPVLADDRGAPVVPGGAAVASISHKRGLAVALVAAAGPARVGVDVEVLAPPRGDLAPRILTDAERAALGAATDAAARGREVVLRFAIKEAIYKAVDPFVRRYVGFREVAVWPDPATGAARVEVMSAADLPLAIEAAFVALGDLVVCTARARRP